MQLPTLTSYTVEKDDTGYPAWAVQRALNAIQGPAIAEDGIYGRETALAVRRFQQFVGLIDDARFGPKTSARMARSLEGELTNSIPEGLIHGLVSGESGDLIGAVNWSSPGGVDCGYCQRRVYTADFSREAVCKRAFDGLYQMKLLRTNLAYWHTAYLGQPGAPGHKRAWQLATLRHNYPSGADKIAQVGTAGLSSYWTTTQKWVTDIGASFPDGSPVQTPLEWCNFYIQRMTRFVEDWTP